MTIRTVNAVEAYALMSRGAALVDIRAADEHARVSIPGSVNVPLDRLTHAALPQASIVIFHCRSGNRTRAHQAALADAAICESYILEGGLDQWRKSGLPVTEDRRQPLELMRQVQIAAGSLILLGVVLGFLVKPAFFGISAFVGAGLIFAGVTGWCGMARLLAAMPWNRRSATA